MQKYKTMMLLLGFILSVAGCGNHSDMKDSDHDHEHSDHEHEEGQKHEPLGT